MNKLASVLVPLMRLSRVASQDISVIAEGFVGVAMEERT